MSKQQTNLLGKFNSIFSPAALLFVFFTYSGIAQNTCEERWTGEFGSPNYTPVQDQFGNLYVWSHQEPEELNRFVKYDNEGGVIFNKEIFLSERYHNGELAIGPSSIYYIGFDVILKFDFEGNELLRVPIFQLNVTDAVVDENDDLIIAATIADYAIINGNVYDRSENSNGRGVRLSFPDLYLAFFKLNQHGDVLWHVTSQNLAQIFDITIDDSGYIIGAGYANGNITLGGSTLVNNVNSSQMILTKMDPDGNVLWVRNIFNAAGFKSYDIQTIQSDIYILGTYRRDLIIDDISYPVRGASDGLLAKVSDEGELIWWNKFGSPNDDTYSKVEGRGELTFLEDGSIGLLTNLFPKGDTDLIEINKSGTQLSDSNSIFPTYVLKYAPDNGEFLDGYPINNDILPQIIRKEQNKRTLLGAIGSNNIETHWWNSTWLTRKNVGLMVSKPFTRNLDDINISINWPDRTQTYLGDSITLEAQVTSTNQIQWYHNGTAISGANELVLNATKSGDYWAVVNSENGCSLRSRQTYTLDFVETSRENDSLILMNMKENMRFYPNPINLNWPDGPLNNWEGVTLRDDRVVGLELPNKNIVSFPSLSLLTELENIDLSGNYINDMDGMKYLKNLVVVNLQNNEYLASILDLSQLPNIESYDVSGDNNLSIADLEPNVVIDGFKYSSKNENYSSCQDAKANDCIEIGTTRDGMYTQYEWKKDGILIDHSEPILVIDNFNNSHQGQYVRTSTNPNVPGRSKNSAYNVNLDSKKKRTFPTLVDWVISAKGNFRGEEFDVQRKTRIEKGLGSKYTLYFLSAGYLTQLIGADVVISLYPTNCGNFEFTTIEGGTTLYSDGTITWDPNEMELVIPWRTYYSEVTGVTTVKYNGNLESYDPKEQTITFGEIPEKYLGDEPFKLEVESSSGMPVELSIESGVNAIEINNDIVTIKDIGAVKLKASVPGNDTLLASDSEYKSFSIQRAIARISFPTDRYNYDGKYKEIDVRTSPTQLTTYTTYNGNPELPYLPGTYDVVTIAYDSQNYGRATTKMFIVGPEDINSAPLISPNPTRGISSISHHTDFKMIIVQDIKGNTVYEKSRTSYFEETIDLTALDNGIYILKILDENNNISKQRIVKLD